MIFRRFAVHAFSFGLLAAAIGCGSAAQSTEASSDEAITSSGAGGACGGFVAHPKKCAEGLECIATGHPDLPGTCQALASQAGESCGGFVAHPKKCAEGLE